ncbi:alpha-xylosidase [Shouchella shacheensis]|uniref:alpha-xylosidase n=1 Tax=Shouchella shacheensis TaxID=1649580 RepID=UPI00073FC5AB|nr:alpha-xylosidase [Shouchella shacheensis]
MKFSNGCWLNKEGYHLSFPQEVYDLQRTKDEATLFAPFQKIVHPGMTLDGGMLTVKLSSPMRDVIRVKSVHHAGGVEVGPRFALNELRPDITMEETEHVFKFQSGDLTAIVTKEDYSIAFIRKGEELTKSEKNGLSYIRDDQNVPFIREQLSIDVGEWIYGLGERFTSFVKNGQSVEVWNEDGGTGSEQAYKNIPFYVSNKVYGVFVNHPERVSFEIGSEKVSKAQFSVSGEELDYYIVAGDTLKDVLANYTALTGKPPLLPKWSFGLWLSTSFLTSYDEETVNRFIDGMVERDLPMDVFHFDCLWMKEFEWCNFEWDERMFPDPKGMLARLKEKGLKICVWINPYIGQKSTLFAEAKEKGFLIKRADGSVWQWDKWQPGLGVVDFTNETARQWYTEKLETLIDMGVDSFKTDFGERIPTDVVYEDGSNPLKMHNYYTHLYNETVYDLLEKRLGKNEAVLFARSATVGGQQFPVHWGGDSFSNYTSMAETLRGGLSLGLAGFGYWSHDIGGFETGSSPDLYKRWTQFGLLSSHSRYHGSGDYKVPWLYDEEAVKITRQFTKLKIKLMPYLYSSSVETTDKGLPMMRPMMLEFPEDETCHVLDRQYMLGEKLLVAPVFNKEGTVRYYVPKGTWTNMLTNEKVEGEKWHTETHDYTTLPLLVKENTVLAVGGTDSTSDYEYTENVTFHLFEIPDGQKQECLIHDQTGGVVARGQVARDGRRLTFQTTGLKNPYQLVLRNLFTVKSVSGGESEQSPEGALIQVRTPEEVVTIDL